MLSNLPNELLELIFNYIDEEDDVRIWRNLSATSRHCHAIVQPRLYGRWNFDGDKHSLLSLWHYLRTILGCEDLASMVEVVDIRNWHDYLNQRDNWGFKYLDEELPIVRKALDEAQVELHQRGVFPPLCPLDNDGALMVMILTFLPNLKALHALVPDREFFMSQLLQRATGDEKTPVGPRALQQIEQVQLCSTWYLASETSTYTHDELSLDCIWPVFRLPRIRELALCELSLDSYHFPVELYECGYTSSSSITHLSLDIHTLPTTDVGNLRCILDLPRSLTSLSVRIFDHCYSDEAQYQKIHIISDVISAALGKHRDTLEYFDYYHGCKGTSPRTASDSRIRSFSEFPALTHICVTTERLCGGAAGIGISPFPLSSLLPPALKQLCFYAGSGLYSIEGLVWQICDVIRSAEIESLMLENISKSESESTVLEHRDVMHKQISQACSERGVKFTVLEDETAWDHNQETRPRRSKAHRLPRMREVTAQQEAKIEILKKPVRALKSERKKAKEERRKENEARGIPRFDPSMDHGEEIVCTLGESFYSEDDEM